MDDLDTKANTVTLANFTTKQLIAEVRTRQGTTPFAVDQIDAALDALDMGELGQLRRRINALYEHKEKVAGQTGFTSEERTMLDNKQFVDCVKSVRDRLGVGITDAKALVDKWTGKVGAHG